MGCGVWGLGRVWGGGGEAEEGVRGVRDEGYGIRGGVGVGWGAVQCSARRCGAVWCGVVRCGAVQCGTVLCGTRCGTVWRYTVQWGTVRYSAVQWRGLWAGGGEG